MAEKAVDLARAATKKTKQGVDLALKIVGEIADNFPVELKMLGFEVNTGDSKATLKYDLEIFKKSFKMD